MNIISEIINSKIFRLRRAGRAFGAPEASRGGSRRGGAPTGLQEKVAPGRRSDGLQEVPKRNFTIRGTWNEVAGNTDPATSVPLMGF